MNIIKGWITTIIGILIWVSAFLHYTGIYPFPNPNFLSKGSEIGIAIFIGAILIFMPASKIEAIVASKAKTILDKIL